MSEHSPDSSLWHPFADMAVIRHNELVLDRADGVWVWDEQGRRYLDAFASLWYVNVGHGRPEIVNAVAEQMRRLEAFATFADYANRPALDLAERLVALSGMPGARVLLGAGGADGIDTAAKLARRYFFETGEPERTYILSRTLAYHGTHGWGTSLAGIPANREGWGPHVEHTARVRHDSVEDLAATIEKLGPERIAAFFCEPVIGAGGMHPPPDGYIEGVAELCRRHGILFVCDSVICGFGRLGTWFGIERWDVEPDLIVFAKGVTSGYLPLGGVVASARVAEPFFATPGGPMLRHGQTYSGHPTTCAAALANLDLIERDGLLERALVLERQISAALTPFGGHPRVAEVRSGTGALGAIELHEDGKAPAMQLAASMRRQGVLTRALNPTTVAVCPPLTAKQEHVDLIAAAFAAGLDELGKAAGREAG